MTKITLPMCGVALLAAAFGLPGSVWASSYAVSYNSISGFTLAFDGGAGDLSQFTLSVDASVTNYGLDGGLSLKDAPAACLNCSYSNSFTSHGSASEYAYGDAEIVSRQVLSGIGAANSIGEISAFNSTGRSGGSNTMLASFSVTDSPGSVSFGFLSSPYMNASLTSGGVSANTNQLMSISIYQGLTKIFDWKPDGIAGNAFGGNDSTDPFTLNSGLSMNGLFNPGSGSFAASTSSLATGTYTLKITMANYVDATAVPLPAAVWLFGSGLVPLLAIGRRKSFKREKTTKV